MSIAHYITFTRIIISPIFLLTYLEHDALGISDQWLPYVLLILMGISELSDACDGFFARLYNQVTDLGKIFDPMADSIARISVFLTFTQDPVHLPMLLIFVFIYRDSVISTLRTICALKGFALAARPSGKLKAVIQAIAAFCILGMMIGHSKGLLTQSDLQTYSTLFVGVAALYAVYSALDYIHANREAIARMFKPEKSQELNKIFD